MATRSRPRPVGIHEIAEMAGIRKDRAWQLTRIKAFPAPATELASGRVWWEDQVRAFLAERERLMAAGQWPPREPAGDGEGRP